METYSPLYLDEFAKGTRHSHAAGVAVVTDHGKYSTVSSVQNARRLATS